MTARFFRIDPRQPQPDIIQAAAGVIRSNGTVILPTRGLYGLGCDATQARAVKRIFDIKNRPLEKPLPVLISQYAMLDRLVSDIPPLARRLMDAFWPGRVTLIMTAFENLPQGVRSEAGKIGIRWVGHPAAAALVEAAGCPLTGTSANLAGSGGFARVGDIDAQVTASVDMVLDAGALAGGPGSTIVDVTAKTPTIMRHGCVSAKAIMSVFQ